ncbi:MAG: hypothetical protein A2Y78_12475 [Acidobacteria bacterium RBG_13_68_16]|nr:MAG: hypothetical protein A2Y78_12475 [Acidobacteria bacterium RBG_13_68_16]
MTLRNIAGYPSIRLLRREGASEAAVVPPQARALSVRFDERSQHYELRVELPQTTMIPLGSAKRRGGGML